MVKTLKQTKEISETNSDFVDHPIFPSEHLEVPEGLHSDDTEKTRERRKQRGSTRAIVSVLGETSNTS